jgi:hypothetical protein
MNAKTKGILMTAAVAVGVLFLYDRGYLEKIGLPKA